MRSRIAVAGLTLAALLLPRAAAAWGAQGHVIVAAVAERHLTARARALVHGVLGDDPLSDPAVANWADALRDPRTKPWHYVNVPLEAATYDPARDCRRGCAVSALTWAADRLADARAGARERADALRWVVHLAADLHQPLHAGDGLDRGGNDLWVRVGRRRQPRTFHAIWDGDVVRALVRGADPRDVAAALDAGIAPGRRAAWAVDLDFARWAEAAHREARTLYRELGLRPGSARLVDLPRDYLRAQAPRAAEDLARAGVRLAALLDAVAARAGAVR